MVRVRRALVAASGETYSRDAFLAALPSMVRQQLPIELRGFHLRRRWGLIQFSYQNPRLHYEVWLQPNADRIEVGLHLEADAATNDRVLEAIGARSLEILEGLGAHCDAEVWTSTWRRVHRVIDLEPLDGGKLSEVADWLARCIALLQPIVEEASGAVDDRLHQRGRHHIRQLAASSGVNAAADDDPR